MVLGLATLPLAQARFDLSFTAGTARPGPVAEGAQLLQEVGTAGHLRPHRSGGGAGRTSPPKRWSLIRMEQALSRQPGVARVLGPDDSPFTDPEGIVLAEDGDAARFVVIFDSDPLAARAIDHVRRPANVWRRVWSARPGCPKPR